MKKTFASLLLLSAVTLTYGQQHPHDKEQITVTANSVTFDAEHNTLLFADDVSVTIDNKLELESERALFDKDQNLLKTYGTRRFSFNGVVVSNKENKRVCKYYLGTDTLNIE